MTLVTLVNQSAQCNPDALAVKGPDGELTYVALDRLANRVAHTLTARGVRKGERVGIWLEKSIYAVAFMQGILRVGAVYIPLDPFSPAPRIEKIVRDCEVSLLICMRQRLERLARADLAPLQILYVEQPESWETVLAANTEPGAWGAPELTDLAYILYTSGSTGTPKGICISHQNALAFVQWAVEAFQVSSQDRLANVAPLHFDLSVFDLYAAFSRGATVYLVPEGLVPEKLVAFVVRERITIWYSVPAALIAMMDAGGLCELTSLPLRLVLFAGEAFPLKHFRRLYQRWSASVRFWNLYGPTETNVCTCFEPGAWDGALDKPLPIGRACSGDQVWAVKEDGSRVEPTETGELVVSGPTVMQGYWGQLAQGNRPYFTGDLVRLGTDGVYSYVGRRDEMRKVRGYRIEPGEIEAVLAEHPAIHEVAVIVTGEAMEARLVACAVSKTEPRPSLLQLKKNCAEHLPRYMIIDALRFFPALPRTRNGKIDRLELARYLDQGATR